jgi:L-threonylcarbamoyladenylate synthase
MSAAADIDRAVALLRAGELVAFPTETVYGLGADAGNVDAVGRIYALKGRPSNHPVIVHLAGASQLRDWALDPSPQALALAAGFWPGPLTLVLERAPHVLDAVTGGQGTVALRVPGHPLALALLHAFGASARPRRSTCARSLAPPSPASSMAASAQSASSRPSWTSAAKRPCCCAPAG